MTCFNILTVGSSEVIRFASEEFERLLLKADPSVKINRENVGKEGALKIGIGDGIPKTEAEESLAPSDAIDINVAEGKGYITGSNERSVLFAVYRFFRELGAKFIRPGRDGEIMPRLDASKARVLLSEKPAARYRGICIEGSLGYEHIIDMIDLLPKLGLNIFFTQLWRPTFALDRWYKRGDSPSYVPSELSDGEIDAIVSAYSRELARRGIDHHKMGHGWIPHTLGEECGIWHGPSDPKLPRAEDIEILAEIDGKRALMGGSAVDTSLCYSNPSARSRIVREVVKYAEENPDVHDLHVWLADQPNNQCECENCRNTLPSDFYVEMLNEIDAALTERNIGARIYFLSYLELLWAPIEKRLNNPDRFVLVFAPIRRPYHRPLSAQREGKLIPFKRNAWVNPCDSYSSLLYLDEWRKGFFGDTLLFDYHLMWDMYNDLTGESTGRMLGLDMAELPLSRLDGMISCQGIRIGILGALPTVLMADALWSGKAPQDSDILEYFEAQYGSSAKTVRELLKRLRGALDPNMLRGATPIPEDLNRRIDDARLALCDIQKLVYTEGLSCGFERRVSFIYLGELARLSSAILDFLSAYTENDSDKGLSAWSSALEISREIEALYPKAFDAFE